MIVMMVMIADIVIIVIVEIIEIILTIVLATVLVIVIIAITVIVALHPNFPKPQTRKPRKSLAPPQKLSKPPAAALKHRAEVRASCSNYCRGSGFRV